MKTCPDIDTFTVPGNHDVGKKNMHPAGWLGYEKQFMESYFYFEVGQRVFIGLDSEVYKQSYDVATEKRQEQSQWLKTLLARLPKTQPKTVFMHTPLFIEDHNEIASAEEGKTCDYKKINTSFQSLGESVPIEQRFYLLDLFAENNVDTVFSGHTHFESLPPPYRGVQQLVLTSINYLGTWHSTESGKSYGPEFGNNDNAYYIVEVNGSRLPRITKHLL